MTSAIRPGEDEEDERRRDVEDPDPLVVRRDEPARHPPALPGGYRLSPGCHSAGSPSGSWPARRSARRVQLGADGGHRRAARPLRTRVSSACGFGERRRPGDPRRRCRPHREAVALGAHAFPLLLAELGGAVVWSCGAARATRRTPPATSPRPTRASARARGRRAPRTARCRRLRLSASNHVSFVRPGDRVDLAAERGDPPGVDDVRVGRAHDELHRDAGRRAHLVDRDDAVRVLVLPVELAAGHLDLELLLSGRRVGDVLDPRELG